MLSNQTTGVGQAGWRETYERMARGGELEAFQFVTPVAIARVAGQDAARAELMKTGQTLRPNVVLVMTPKAFGHEPAWVAEFLRRCDQPIVLYWEGDPWHRWAKPVNRSMGAWLAAADVVFTPAREPQTRLLRRAGARDVRFMPHTYCHVVFGEAETNGPLAGAQPVYDIVLIGSRLAHLGGLSRVPGAGQRAKVVRRLQRVPGLRVAVYGAGWSGPGAKGALPFKQQVDAIRQGLLSVNWDHFPRHESYASDRLAISLIAGRPHLTTAHPGFDWIPGERMGLFVEKSVKELLERARELVAAPAPELLALGARGHEWVRGRLSDREASRFVLGAADDRFLVELPTDPWLRLAGAWPR
jgi:hypothetical protein